MRSAILSSIFFLLCLTFVPEVSAKSIKYLHKALVLDACYVQYNVVKNDSTYYIVVIVESDRLHFMNEPSMKVLTFNDETLTFPGVVVTNGSFAGALMVSSVVMGSVYSMAQFSVTPQEFEKMKDGIAEIRLSMVPDTHNHSFRKPSFGKKLYKLFLEAKEKDEFNKEKTITRREKRMKN